MLNTKNAPDQLTHFLGREELFLVAVTEADAQAWDCNPTRGFRDTCLRVCRRCPRVICAAGNPGNCAACAIRIMDSNECFTLLVFANFLNNIAFFVALDERELLGIVS